MCSAYLGDGGVDAHTERLEVVRLPTRQLHRELRRRDQTEEAHGEGDARARAWAALVDALGFEAPLDGGAEDEEVQHHVQRLERGRAIAGGVALPAHGTTSTAQREKNSGAVCGDEAGGGLSSVPSVCTE